MATRSAGATASIAWLTNAVNLGSRNAKAVFGGAALLLLVGIVPTIVQVLLQPATGGGQASATLSAGWMMFAMLYSLLVMPPVTAGYLRLIHATQIGADTRSTAIFDVFRDGAGRVIALALALVLLAFVLLACIMLMFGEGMLVAMQELLSAIQAAKPGTTPVMPPLPAGFGPMVFLMLVVALLFNGIYALSMSQVALGGRGVGEALRDGLAGTLKNLTPLILMLVIVLVVGAIGGFLAMLVIGLLALVGGLIHPVVAAVLVAPLYLALMLAVYVVSFGVMYFMWRDICADGDMATAVRQDQLEV